MVTQILTAIALILVGAGSALWWGWWLNRKAQLIRAGGIIARREDAPVRPPMTRTLELNVDTGDMDEVLDHAATRLTAFVDKAKEAADLLGVIDLPARLAHRIEQLERALGLHMTDGKEHGRPDAPPPPDHAKLSPKAPYRPVAGGPINPAARPAIEHDEEEDRHPTPSNLTGDQTVAWAEVVMVNAAVYSYRHRRNLLQLRLNSYAGRPVPSELKDVVISVNEEGDKLMEEMEDLQRRAAATGLVMGRIADPRG